MNIASRISRPVALRLWSMLLPVLLGLGCWGLSLPLRAQTYTYAPGFWNGLSITLGYGAHHPAAYNYTQALLSDGGTVGINKQFVPSFGLTTELDLLRGKGKLPGSQFSRSMVSIVGRINLMNLFDGYYGRPRIFEMQLRGGVGWGHTFSTEATVPDQNYIVSKTGLELNCNIGASRALTIGLRPEVIFDLRNGGQDQYESFSFDRADWRLLLALTVHFGNGHGGRHPALVTPTKIYSRSLLPATASAAPPREVQRLQRPLARQTEPVELLKPQMAQQSSAVATRVVTEVLRESKLEYLISFNAGDVTVASDQFATLERIASHLRRNPSAIVLLRGYSSPDGSVQINERVARQRAEVVKSLFVGKYHIQTNRIVVEGKGVGRLFADPKLNRMVICTIMQ
ncbi:MAG: OmpA family protein [Bacteroidaceae bacterium]|nr:OmpA family protein [Bacteroidaceae bacterium]